MGSDTAKLLCSIDKTITEVKSFSQLDATLDGYLAQFLSVYISGVYEEIVETIFLNYARSKSSGSSELVNYVESMLDEKFRNPNFKKILELTSKFNKAWCVELQKSAAAEKSALDSIVTHKNNLAHGSISSPLTISDIENYELSARKIFINLDTIVI